MKKLYLFALVAFALLIQAGWVIIYAGDPLTVAPALLFLTVGAVLSVVVAAIMGVGVGAGYLVQFLVFGPSKKKAKPSGLRIIVGALSGMIFLVSGCLSLVTLQEGGDGYFGVLLPMAAVVALGGVRLLAHRRKQAEKG